MRVHKKKSVCHFLCVALFFAVTLAGGTVFASQSFLEAGEAYLVGLGDVLEIQVWNEPDLSRTVNVRLDGVISLPLVGDVTVVGKPIPEITQVLEKRYGDLIEEPTVTVILTESRSRKYYLIGQVAQSGEFPLDSPISLLQAIARGGGFSEWAKKDRVGVVRRQSGKDSILKFNYETFVKGENLQQNFLIEPGDTIVVP
ncbi:MAG: polysaccharide biosynthesis/export family protein [Desulfobulbaceae bacterium]|nr:polysaccharide biosynthesis/export family protein [Desulfobulbaceae bacterium]